MLDQPVLVVLAEVAEALQTGAVALAPVAGEAAVAAADRGLVVLLVQGGLAAEAAVVALLLLTLMAVMVASVEAAVAALEAGLLLRLAVLVGMELAAEVAVVTLAPDQPVALAGTVSLPLRGPKATNALPRLQTLHGSRRCAGTLPSLPTYPSGNPRRWFKFFFPAHAE